MYDDAVRWIDEKIKKMTTRCRWDHHAKYQDNSCFIPWTGGCPLKTFHHPLLLGSPRHLARRRVGLGEKVAVGFLNDSWVEKLFWREINDGVFVVLVLDDALVRENVVAEAY